ncbi:hypothetical protein [Lentzea sp. E54]|uniref:hypothetical protein n=1 Tax=Lentzea xerophila TaxID=3435883 RepID=UPI003DA4FC0C
MYFLHSSGRGGLTGIWQVHRSGEPRLVVPLPADTFPNALVADRERARVLVTGGRMWQAPLRAAGLPCGRATPTAAPSSASR